MSTPRHLLLVAEDAEVRLAVDRQLDDLGWSALIVRNGAEALRILTQDVRVDVLLTDVRLPDMDGRELAWAVCQKRPFTRVAFMGHAAPAEPLAPLNAPFLTTPFTTTALSNALTAAVPFRRSASKP